MTITCTNVKGGTGKTSLNIYLAEYLFRHGKNVLIIDLDANCSITEVYKQTFAEENSKKLLLGEKVAPIPVKKDDAGGALSIVPACLDLSMMSNVIDNQVRIQMKKQGLSDAYEYIIIDPPGTWNAQTRNAIFAADKLFIVGKTSPLDFFASCKFFEQLQDYDIRADVQVVVNDFSTRSDPTHIIDSYRSEFGEFLFPVPIPSSNTLKQLSKNPDFQIRKDIKRKFDSIFERFFLKSIDK